MRRSTTGGRRTPRMRGIQYAAASRFHHWRLWNTGSPAQCAIAHKAGDDSSVARDFKHSFAISRHDCPRFAERFPSMTEGAGNAGCALHPRSRVQDCAKKTHTSIQVQRKHSGIPCAMALRLMPRSPRRRIRLVTVAAGLMADRSGWIASATGSLAPATGVGTTRFCRTRISVVRPARRTSLTSFARPAITLRADAAASTASHPAFVTIAIRPSCRERTGQAGRADLPDGESEIFLLTGLDSFC